MPILDASIRPYNGLEGFEGVLANLALRVMGQGIWTTEEVVRLQPEDFQPLGLHLKWELDEAASTALDEALKKAGLTADDIILAVITRAPGIKQMKLGSKVLLRDLMNASGLSEYEVDVQDRPRLLQGRAFTVSVFLALGNDKPGNFPRPFIKGTWLAQKTFELTSVDSFGFEFEWLPLTKEVRESCGLPRDSVTFVQNNVAMHVADRFSECIYAYIDDQYDQAIKSFNSDATGRLLQGQLVKSVVLSALEFTARQINEAGLKQWDEVEQSSVLGKFVRNLASKTQLSKGSLSEEELFSLVIDQPSSVAWLLDGVMGVRQLSVQIAGEERP